LKTSPASSIVERLASQGHLIGGTWRSSGSSGTYEHRNPTTGRTQAIVGLAGAEDVDDAVEAAHQAKTGWSRRSPGSRATILFRLSELLDQQAGELAELTALDNGTPVSVINPGRYAAAWVRYYAGWCDKLGDEALAGSRGHVRLEPYGVVAAIPPWNGSIMGMGQKCGPALAAGNVIVAKPPEIAPFGMLRFAELAAEAGLPPGVLNVVVGGAGTGEALVGHPGVDKITFTGGSSTGRAIMEIAARNLTPVTLELGGKSPNIIFPDADLEAAATMAAYTGAAVLSGQGCALPTRLYVHADVYDQVTTRLVDTVASLKIGDPLDPETVVGPVVTEAAMRRILGVIDRAKSDGAALLTGGTRSGGELADGWFVEPTVFGHVEHHSELARNEVFGPVLAVMRFETDDEVLDKANDSDFGLFAYLHTHDLKRIERFVSELECGTVVVNGMGQSSPDAPFGGTKKSGFGREGGRAGIEEMVRTKTVFGPT
jgi:aldehyde dehydrogenase (NAD+)